MEENKKIDRRVIKTTRAICNAFIDLLAQKDIDSITITELAKKADVNRKTIYNYYSSVHDILDTIENKVVSSFEQAIRDLDAESGLENSKVVFERLTKVISTNLTSYEKLLTLNANSKLLVKFLNLLKGRVKEEFLKHRLDNDQEAEIASSFITAGMLAAYESWFNSKERTSIDEFSKDVSKLIFYGVSSIINK